MEQLEKAELLNELFSAYKLLFTEKQIEYFEMYYMLDFSFQEIADEFGISRNAVYDQLKKVEENLFIYEEKLNLIKRRKQRLALIESYKESNDSQVLEELKRMDE